MMGRLWVLAISLPGCVIYVDDFSDDEEAGGFEDPEGPEGPQAPGGGGNVGGGGALSAGSGEGVICDRDVYGYESATLSIEHNTFADSSAVGNDWDLLFGNDQDPGEDIFTVNMVTDDRSWVVDLCDVGSVFDIAYDVLPGDHLADADLDNIPVVEGHTYVIRTHDDDTSQFAAFKVLEHVVDDNASIVWCRSVDPDGFEPDPSCGALW